MNAQTDLAAEFGSIGVATTYEASGKQGLIDVDLIQVVPGSRVAGRARTVLCGQDDNRAVHEAVAAVREGEVLVLTMPQPRPVTLIGELLATQAKAHGAAAMLVDAAVRDVDDLRSLGLPIWCRWIRVAGPTKNARGRLDVPVVVGGASVTSGDVVVLDSDGAVVVRSQQVDTVLHASQQRQQAEASKRRSFQGGELSYDLYGMRAEDAAR